MLVLLVGRPVLAALRRVSRQAAFGAPVAFSPAEAPELAERAELAVSARPLSP